MKRLILILVTIVSSFLKAQSPLSCTILPCYPMSSQDNENLFQAIMYNHTVTVNGGSITSGSVAVTNTVQVTNGTGDMATKANQAVEIVTLTNIYNAINNLTTVTQDVNVTNQPTVNIYMGGSNYIIRQLTVTTTQSAAVNYTAGNAVTTSSTATTSAESFTLPPGAWMLVACDVVYANMNNTAKINSAFFTGTVQMSTNNGQQTWPPASAGFVGAVDYHQTGNTSVSTNANGLPNTGIYSGGAAVSSLPIYFQSGVTTFYHMPTVRSNFSTNGANSSFIFNLRFVRVD